MSSERSEGGGLRAGFVLLLFVGFVVKFWVWILAGIAAVPAIALVFYLMHRSDKRRAVKIEQSAAIAARADEQHAQLLAGDDRGLYGIYPRPCRQSRHRYRSGCRVPAKIGPTTLPNNVEKPSPASG